ncbi:MAG TPA: Hsp20/alpha crystallin family protein [Paralcaligenes sp.]|jgi:HSP20 family molecular chaperone IbpA
MSDTNVVERKPETDREPAPLLPAVDVYEDSRGITLHADFPGVPKENLSLQIKDETLVIEGTIDLNTPESMEIVHAEIDRSRYLRTFSLSKELDAEKIDAHFEAGVLTLHIPRAEHAKPKRIEVKVA